MLEHMVKNLENMDIKIKLKVTDKNWIFKGHLCAKEIINEFKESFSLLHPSLIDNRPNSVCEAQVLGLPIIASSVGVVPSFIDNGKTGLLTTLEPSAIVNKILLLLKDEKLKESISVKRRNFAKKRHNPTIILDKTIATYQEIKNEYDKIDK